MKTGQKYSFFFGLKPFAALAAALALSGCLPSTGTPVRLYPVAAEMEVVKNTQEELVRLYNTYVFSAPAQARLYRNEIIAQRMFAVDVLYTQYESALTREGQEVNFGTLVAAGTLGTASQLFTPTVTKSVLSGLSTVTLAANGHYNTDILMAQSIRTIQKQMRASRNLIAADISAKTIKSVFDYPLSAALSDVEDYYNAGTLTTGVTDASTTVGIRETATKELKQDVTQAAPAARADIIREAAMNGTGGGGFRNGDLPKSGQGKEKITCSSNTTSMPDDNTKIINNWLRPGGTVNIENQNRLKSLVKSMGGCFIVAQFLTAKELADSRAQFVQTLRSENQIK
ncbi:MAG: hypothetical protein JWR80_4126 [Bradyrhizobium sp.]|nr:hypothetical protein [Bradyrhizobium sp.]